MSIKLENIHCSQRKNYFEKCGYPSFQFPVYNSEQHIIVDVRDTINYRTLITGNFEMYKKFLEITYQPEHNQQIYKKLIDEFDLTKMEKIKIQFDSIIGKYVIRDGVHRLCILVYKKIITDSVPLEYLKIV